MNELTDREKKILEMSKLVSMKKISSDSFVEKTKDLLNPPEKPLPEKGRLIELVTNNDETVSGYYHYYCPELKQWTLTHCSYYNPVFFINIKSWPYPEPIREYKYKDIDDIRFQTGKNAFGYSDIIKLSRETTTEPDPDYCITCQQNEKLEGYPDPDCPECKGTGKPAKQDYKKELK